MKARYTFTSRTILLCIFSAILALSTFALTLMGFASKSAFATDTEEGIRGINVALNEDIVVKYHTTATTGDGTKLVVNFNDADHEITVNIDGVFSFAGVTPQHLNDEMTATLYSSTGTVIGEPQTTSVKAYLQTLLTQEFGDSGCETELQFKAMKELAVNMLNYGAAAQSYVNEDVENLANKDLTSEQQELASATITDVQSDKAVVGDAWVGAGVRFDYKLGLFFIFKAETLDGITATINDVAVTPEEYSVNGVSDKCWIIRYSAFNATNMNDVVTAKLTIGETEQTFAYSIKSYVAAKGGDQSAIANLVNATYVYGYAAVAYSAKYTEIVDAPTFAKAGEVAIDGKGYDFSDSDYATIEIPALNLVDYTASTNWTNKVTTFTYGDFSLDLSITDRLIVDNASYSKYDVAKLNDASVEFSYDEEKGYAVDAKTEKTFSRLMPTSAGLTITGTVNIETSTRIDISGGIEFNVGTADKTATVRIVRTAMTDKYSVLGIWNGSVCTVENGTLTVVGVYADKTGNGAIALNEKSQLIVKENGKVVTEGYSKYSIYIAANQSGQVIVDGEMVCNQQVYILCPEVKDETAEYGFVPALYVRKGTFTATTEESVRHIITTLQVGSESENASGTFSVTAVSDPLATHQNGRLVFAKGNVTFAKSPTAGGWGIQAGATVENVSAKSLTVEFKEGITINGDAVNYILAISGRKSTQYWMVEDGATFTSMEATFQIKSSENVKLMVYKTVEMNVDGEVKTVKVATVINGNSSKTAIDYTIYDDLNAPTIEQGSTWTTQDGEINGFKKASDGTNTVYYQIVE